MISVIWIVPLVFGAAGGGVVAWLVCRAAQSGLRERLAAAQRERDQQVTARTDAESQWRDANARAARLEAELDAERKHTAQRLKDLENARGELTNQFKALSQEILEEKTKAFTETNKTNIEGVLKPVRERIDSFQKKVDDVYNRETRDRTALKEEIKHLKSLHQQMSEDAKRLTNALKGDAKAQGNWGEVVLKRVFEVSGLTEGREYELQVNIASAEGGRLIPDAVVHLPEGRDMVVDAKVSLTAYERLFAADNEADSAGALAAHLQSVRSHIDRLAGKDYQNLAGIETLDFVLMFVPVEGAYIEAVRADAGLHDYALGKNVALLSPANMLPTLRVVEHMWRVDKQSRNARTIAEEAGKLYDKFVNFVKDVEEIDSRLKQAQKACDNAGNKLASGRGHLLGKAEKLRTLGAKSSRQLSRDTRMGGALDEPEAAEDGDHP